MNTAMLCDNPGDKRLDSLLVANVSNGKPGRSAIGRDLGGNLLKLFLLAANEDDHRAETCKLMRRAPSNAATAARNDMHLAVKKRWLKHATITLVLSHAA